MKNLLDYIGENSMTTLKDNILRSIEMIDDDKLLRKIYRELSIPKSAEYDSIISNIKEYFKERCGMSEDVSAAILQKIKHANCLRDITVLINAIKENNHDLYAYFDAVALDKNTNIYNIIEKFATNIITIEPEFTELLHDIANCTISDNNIAVGRFEYLTRIFMHDLNKGNAKLTGKEVCDINTKKYSIEYKENKARISGNKNDSKTKNAEVITNTAIKLAVSEIKDSSIKKKLTSMEDIFSNVSSILSYIDICLSNGISPEKLNKIIADAFMSQLPKGKLSDEDKKFIYSNYTIIPETGDYNKNIKNNSTVSKIMDMWLVLNLYNYYQAEKFDYIILFTDKDKGEYISIKFDIDMTVSEIKTIVDKYHITCGGSKPRYSDKAIDRNSYPYICVE